MIYISTHIDYETPIYPVDCWVVFQDNPHLPTSYIMIKTCSQTHMLTFSTSASLPSDEVAGVGLHLDR